MRDIIAALAILFLHVVGIQASYYGIDYHAKAAYFNYQDEHRETLYVWTISVTDNDDVYFHMSGPVSHCWLGVGFGTSMKDAFMLIAYPSASGLETTISPRISTGYTEPYYDPSYEIHKIYNDTYAPSANLVTDNGTGTTIAHAVCRGCAKWNTPNGPRQLDLTSKEQPFIFAIGPNITLRSDDPAASLPRHSLVGRFTMDMYHATNYTGWYGRVPAPNVPDFVFPPNDTDFTSFASLGPYDVRRMSNPMPGAHAALMLTAFVLLFPTGALVMQFLKKVLWHGVIQTLGFAMVFAGFGLATQFSGQYIKSKHYNSAHQIIGFICLAGLVIQLGLGLVHHAFYMKSRQPTPFGRVHFFFGPCIIILGLVNGGLGIHLAADHHLIVPYAAVTAVIGFIFVGAISCYVYMSRRRIYKPDVDEKEEYIKGSDSMYEMSESSGYGDRPPDPYMPPEPFTPLPVQLMPPAAYSSTMPYSSSAPYSPITALPPGTHYPWPGSYQRQDSYGWQ